MDRGEAIEGKWKLNRDWKKDSLQLGMVAYPYNAITWEVEGSSSSLHRKVKDSLAYVTPSQTK